MSEPWVRLASIFGPAVPPDAAEIIIAAVREMIYHGDVTPEARWRAIELLCADYLAGVGRSSEWA